MSINIVRAGKDRTHRQKVSTEKQAPLPADLACEIELTDADLETIYGGQGLGGLTGGIGDLVGGAGDLVGGAGDLVGGARDLVGDLGGQ